MAPQESSETSSNDTANPQLTKLWEHARKGKFAYEDKLKSLPPMKNFPWRKMKEVTDKDSKFNSWLLFLGENAQQWTWTLIKEFPSKIAEVHFVNIQKDTDAISFVKSRNELAIHEPFKVLDGDSGLRQLKALAKFLFLESGKTEQDNLCGSHDDSFKDLRAAIKRMSKIYKSKGIATIPAPARPTKAKGAMRKSENRALRREKRAEVFKSLGRKDAPNIDAGGSPNEERDADALAEEPRGPLDTTSDPRELANRRLDIMSVAEPVSQLSLTETLAPNKRPPPDVYDLWKASQKRRRLDHHRAKEQRLKEELTKVRTARAMEQREIEALEEGKPPEAYMAFYQMQHIGAVGVEESDVDENSIEDSDGGGASEAETDA